MNVKFSCVVDRDIKFQVQALSWLFTLLGTGTASAREIMVHVVGSLPHFEATAESLGVAVRRVESDAMGDSAYCNKLLQLTSTELLDADLLVLCDTDIAFAGNIRPFLDGVRCVSAKTVDVPNPPLPLLEALLHEAGLNAPLSVVDLAFSQGRSIEVNCNGGFYVIPGAYTRILGSRWKHWAGWSLGRKTQLGNYLKHSDQIGFCMAMVELGLPFAQLPVRYNFPTHLSPDRYRFNGADDPEVLHYHWLMDHDGYVIPVGHAVVDSAIARANNILKSYSRPAASGAILSKYRCHNRVQIGPG